LYCLTYHNHNFNELVMREEIKKLLQEIEQNKDKKVTIYSFKSCPACIELKKKLNKINVLYEEVDMEDNEPMWDQLKKEGGSNFVPQVRVENYLIKENEYDDVNQLISRTVSNMVGRKIVIKS
jgi:glutaredoxin 3